MRRLCPILFVACTLTAPLARAAPVCAFGMIPCHLFCGGPPSLANADEVYLIVRAQKYDALNWFDEFSAVVTTQFGKCLGINGWRRYQFNVWASGTVYQAATSWDGLRTVDIELDNFNGHGGNELTPRPRYIRAEVIRHVWRSLNRPPRCGDVVRVSGELHWDGHGFLEIHPAKIGDVTYLKASPGPAICITSPGPASPGASGPAN